MAAAQLGRLTLLPPGRPIRIGHRGLSARCPENSLESFDAAVRAGAAMVELDVGQSSDGVLVVMHDDAVDRTTDGHGRVDAHPVAHLRRLRLKNGERVPLLEEVLERLRGRACVDVEVKEVHDLEAAIRQLERSVDPTQVVLSSFDAPLLRRLRRALAGVPLAFIVDRPLADAAGEVIALGAGGLHPEASLVGGVLVESLHAQGLWAFPWTVNDPCEARRLAALGVDGIVSDDVGGLGLGA